MTITCALVLAWEKVARVSSWSRLPWIITVYSLRPISSLFVQTFSTKGHVVSYLCKLILRSFNSFSISMVVPKAGTITTSSVFSSSKGINRSPEVVLMNCTPRFFRSSLTWGLWIISDKRNTRLSGFSSSAWYAISIAFSTPKQKPKCLAILKQIGPKFNIEGDRSRLRGSVMRRACLIREMIGLRKKCGTSNVRDKLNTPEVASGG